ncbi:hypothetical protein [Streptomyces sp. RG80]|uniref:hypothetical protein n=1 Tax=Streptomyces sp. RG80 TaxID=3157340 RepID=UPI00338E0C19
MTELALRIDGLTKSDDGSEAWARSAEATVFPSYADLPDALGLELTRGYGSDRTPQGLQGRGPRRPARGR